MNRLGLKLLVIALFGCSVVSWSQILPHLSGEALRTALSEEYKPGFVELYTDAKTIMFTEIYNEGDSVESFYSGHQKYLPPWVESPIQFLYANEDPSGIGTEHIYPPSKGASEENGNAYSDLHNLVPARIEVKQARSDYPFAEIGENKEDYWFYRDKTLSEPLGSEDNFSDQSAQVDIVDSYFDGFFEPRDQVKGDIARAMFYFYTMYREEADRADPEYFAAMKEDLCQWHDWDPVDSTELARNFTKAGYQNGKSNPFILDCTLAGRLYCKKRTSQCINLSTDELTKIDVSPPFMPEVKVIPNTDRGSCNLDISNTPPGKYHLQIFDRKGILVFSMKERLDYFNTLNIWNSRSGLYYLHLINMDSGSKFSKAFQTVN